MSDQRIPQTTDAADYWLVLQYLTGDLDQSEWATFEDRLAHDAGLQIALAETVKLTTGISRLDSHKALHPSCRPTRVNNQSGQFRKAFGWQVVSTAAAAVGLVALGLLIQPTSPDSVGDLRFGNGESSRLIASADVRSVVSLWSSLASDGIVSDDSSAASETNSPDADSSDELDVPDWLLLAVRDETDEAASGGFPANESL